MTEQRRGSMTANTRCIWGGLLIVGSLLLSGCSTPPTPPDLLAPTDAQLKIRSLQTRMFDVKDRNTAMRTVTVTLITS